MKTTPSDPELWAKCPGHLARKMTLAEAMVNMDAADYVAILKGDRPVSYSQGHLNAMLLRYGRRLASRAVNAALGKSNFKTLPQELVDGKWVACTRSRAVWLLRRYRALAHHHSYIPGYYSLEFIDAHGPVDTHLDTRNY